MSISHGATDLTSRAVLRLGGFGCGSEFCIDKKAPASGGVSKTNEKVYAGITRRTNEDTAHHKRALRFSAFMSSVMLLHPSGWTSGLAPGAFLRRRQCPRAGAPLPTWGSSASAWISCGCAEAGCCPISSAGEPMVELVLPRLPLSGGAFRSPGLEQASAGVDASLCGMIDLAYQPASS